jgi:hypothetical protein
MAGFSLDCNNVELVGAEIYKKRKLKCEPRRTLMLY